MGDKKIPDAVIRETAPGVLTYEQNPYEWAKNTGQNMPGIYQESIRVGGPYEEAIGADNPEAFTPVLAVATRDQYVTSADPKLMMHMAMLLKAAKADGAVQPSEQMMFNRIIRDAGDDGKLNGSVPNVLVKSPAKGPSR